MVMVHFCIFILLLLNSFLDLKKQEISLWSLAVFGILGVFLNVWISYQSIWEVAGGIGVGIFLLMVAFLTKEAVGFGDGLLLCVTGIYLGFWENVSFFFIGLLLCALLALVCLLFHKRQLSDRFPLVPFLLLGWIGRMIW